MLKAGSELTQHKFVLVLNAKKKRIRELERGDHKRPFTDTSDESDNRSTKEEDLSEIDMNDEGDFDEGVSDRGNSQGEPRRASQRLESTRHEFSGVDSDSSTTQE